MACHSNSTIRAHNLAIRWAIVSTLAAIGSEPITLVQCCDVMIGYSSFKTSLETYLRSAVFIPAGAEATKANTSHGGTGINTSMLPHI